MFKFDLNQFVEICGTNQDGTIVARAEYSRSSNNQYNVEHRDADGNLVQRWYDEVVLVAT